MSGKWYVGKRRLWLLVLFSVVVMISCFFHQNMNKVEAAMKKATSKTTDLRLIFTTDIHGQLNTTDYSTGKAYEKGSLAKAYTLIKEARGEVDKKNYMTFDIGDVLYSYSTDYIMGQDESALQPIYKAMASVKYDAITIGNHDLDFGLSYLKDQLRMSGLDQICVSSNVDDVLTEDSVWNNTMMITKRLKATDGTFVTVKVGIIGEVVPVLSSKTEDYTGVLSSEDIVLNAKKEAAALRAQGADLVVVLSHSGMGDAVPEEMAKNASYAVSQLDDVDVVLCGHEHRAFPSDEEASKAYYSLPGVNASTGLINGKVIAMSKNNGQSIGVVDLGLKITDGQVKITKQGAQIRMVNAKTTAANETANTKFMGEWAEKLLKLIEDDTVVATFDENTSVNSYFGVASDTDAIQLINNAKLYYGMKFIHEKLPSYEQYPVIAATKYDSYGEIDGMDYMDIRGSLKETQLSQLHSYTLYVGVYEITGKQLREWLEWSASAYRHTLSDTPLSNDNLQFYSEQYNIKSLINEEWINDWRNFYVFDGVEYEIDPSVVPRYSIDGALINDSHRITRLTLNGVEVQDGQKFVLIGTHMSDTAGPSKDIPKQKLKATGYKRVQTIVKSYLKHLSEQGNVGKLADNNWSLKLNPGDEYLLKSGINSNEEAIRKNYYLIGSDGQYNYYKMVVPENTDTDAPNVVASALTTQTTNNDVEIRITANDRSGLSKLLYASGKRDKSDSYWDTSNQVFTSFKVVNNMTYTVCAEDTCGNRRLAYVTVNNINRDVLEAPTLKKFTNRMVKVKGKGEPLANVVVSVAGKTYETTVDAKGNFACPVPCQAAGTAYTVYLQDSSGRMSSSVVGETKRNGPNRPAYEQMTNKENKLKGTIDDKNVTIIAYINGTVYVSDQDGEKIWKKSELYNSSATVIPTTLTFSGNNFTMNLDEPYAGYSLKVYALDAIGRASHVTSQKIIDEGPNCPEIYDMCDAENTLYGRIPETKEGMTYKVHIIRGGEERVVPIDNFGRFSCDFEDGFSIGDDIRIFASDEDLVGGIRYSASRKPQILDADTLISSYTPDLTLVQANNKQKKVRGEYADSDSIIELKIGDEFFIAEPDEDGEFVVDFQELLSADTVVYAVARSDSGDIFETAKMIVQASVPLRPTTDQSDISNADTKIRVYCDEKCTMNVRLNDTTYTAYTEGYNEERELYSYVVNIDKSVSGQEALIYATNQVGHSPVLRLKVRQKAPNPPKIDKIMDTTRLITGNVNLILDPENTATPTVANTKTQVFVRFGGVTYVAKVKKDGSYKVRLKKDEVPRAGTQVKVWAENEYGGTGPTRTVTVKADPNKKRET